MEESLGAASHHPPHPRLLSHRAEGAVCTGHSVTVMTASYALAFAPERRNDHSLGADMGSGSDGGVSPTTRWAQQPPSGRTPGFLDQPVRSPPDAAARFPSLVEAHLHGCKPSICLRKYKPHLGTSDTKFPCNRCLPVRWGGNWSSFYRVWERGSKLPRSGGSRDGALGTWGLQLSIQRRPVVSLSHHPHVPNHGANCTSIQETGQTAA